MSKILPNVVDALRRSNKALEVADIIEDMVEVGMDATIMNLNSLTPNMDEEKEEVAKDNRIPYIDIQGDIFELSKINQMKKVDFYGSEGYVFCIIINPAPNPKGVFYEDNSIEFKTRELRDEVWNKNKKEMEEKFNIRFI